MAAPAQPNIQRQPARITQHQGPQHRQEDQRQLVVTGALVGHRMALHTPGNRLSRLPPNRRHDGSSVGVNMAINRPTSRCLQRGSLPSAANHAADGDIDAPPKHGSDHPPL